MEISRDKDVVRALENFPLTLRGNSGGVGDAHSCFAGMTAGEGDDNYVSRSAHEAEVAKVVALLTRAFQSQLKQQKLWAQQAMSRVAKARDSERTLRAPRKPLSLTTSVRVKLNPMLSRLMDHGAQDATATASSQPMVEEEAAPVLSDAVAAIVAKAMSGVRLKDPPSSEIRTHHTYSPVAELHQFVLGALPKSADEVLRSPTQPVPQPSDVGSAANEPVLFMNHRPPMSPKPPAASPIERRPVVMVPQRQETLIAVSEESPTSNFGLGDALGDIPETVPEPIPLYRGQRPSLAQIRSPLFNELLATSDAFPKETASDTRAAPVIDLISSTKVATSPLPKRPLQVTNNEQIRPLNAATSSRKETLKGAPPLEGLVASPIEAQGSPVHNNEGRATPVSSAGEPSRRGNQPSTLLSPKSIASNQKFPLPNTRGIPCYSLDPLVLRAQLDREKVESEGTATAGEISRKIKELQGISGELREIEGLGSVWARHLADRQVALNELLMQKEDIKGMLKDIRAAMKDAKQGVVVPLTILNGAAVRQVSKVERVAQMRAQVLASFGLGTGAAEGKSIVASPKQQQVPAQFSQVSTQAGSPNSKFSPIGFKFANQVGALENTQNTSGQPSMPRDATGMTPYITTMTIGGPLPNNTFPSPVAGSTQGNNSYPFSSMSGFAGSPTFPAGFTFGTQSGYSNAAKSTVEGSSPKSQTAGKQPVAQAVPTRRSVTLPGGELPQEERVGNSYKSALVVADSVKRKLVNALERYKRIGRTLMAAHPPEDGGVGPRSVVSSLNPDDEAVRLAIVRDCEQELSDLIQQREKIKANLSGAEQFLFHLQEQLEQLKGNDASACQAIAEMHADLLEREVSDDEDTAQNPPQEDAQGFLSIQNTILFAHEKATGATQCDLITNDEPRPNSATVTRFERIFKGEKALIDSVHSLAVSVAHALHLHWSLQAECTCKACLKPFTNPHTMWPCGHTLCEECIERVPNSVSEDTLRCSECGALSEGDPIPHAVISAIVNHQNNLPFPVEDHPYEIGMYNAIIEMLALTGDSHDLSLYSIM